MLRRIFVPLAAAAALSACTNSQTSVTAPDVVNRCDLRATTTASTFTAAGGNATVAVSTARDCTWTISSDTNWVTINGARSGQGEASVGYSVAANPVPSPRAGAIAVGGQRIGLSQAAAPCRFSLSRPGDTIGFGGGRMAFDVSTLSGCNWSASSSQGWVTIVSGQSGNANGTVGISVAANTGARRVAVVNVGDATYTVSQDGAPAPPPPPPNPSPSPSPSPSPTPTPTPLPEVHLEGRAFLVSGGCPDISFSLEGQRVVADRSTDYRKGDCKDVTNGRSMSVTGLQPGDSVRATRIELEKKDDEDH